MVVCQIAVGQLTPQKEDIEYISELYLILMSVVYACTHSSTVLNYNVWVLDEYFHFCSFHKEILFFLLELQYSHLTGVAQSVRSLHKKVCHFC